MTDIFPISDDMTVTGKTRQVMKTAEILELRVKEIEKMKRKDTDFDSILRANFCQK